MKSTQNSNKTYKKRSANEVPLIVWVAYLLGIQIGILISITTIIMYGGI